MITWILVVLLSASFASYCWAVRSFFECTAGLPFGMKILSAAAVCAFVIQTAVIIETSPGLEIGTHLAIVLYVAGVSLFFWACRSTVHSRLAVAFDPKIVTTLVRFGPYRLIRHPLYLSYSFTWLAGVVATNSVFAWVPALVMMVIYAFAAWGEETRILASPLGAEYREYRRSTGMFVPWRLIWPATPRGPSRGGWLSAC